MLNQKHATTLLMIIASLLNTIQMSAQPMTIFTSSAESWSTVGDPGSAPTASWSATGGNPGGCLQGTDASEGVWYWNSPNAAPWKGNLSSYYGCNLNFDLKENFTLFPMDYYDLMIVRTDDAHIVYNTTYDPSSTWTSYSIPLNETGWKWNNTSGAPVTAAEFIEFLTNLKRFRIRAEFSGLNYETNSIDNVLISCVTILPVELGSFTAENPEQNEAVLRWETKSENMCSKFQIEKSLTSRVFDSIGCISGHGTTTQLHNYIYTDTHFTQSAYYRLKEIDENGQSQYSDIFYLDMKDRITVANNGIQIFPTPAQNTLSISTGFYVLSVEVMDITGKPLIIQQVENGSIQNISVAALPEGFYFVRVKTDIAEKVQKIQIVR